MDVQGQGQGERQRPVEAVRAALERAIVTAEGQVYLSVCVRGEDGLGWRKAGTRLSQVTWAAVWDALALDPEDPDWEGDGQPPRAPLPPGERFTDEVARELGRARDLFPALHSGHEGLGVLLEEYREVEQLVFAGTPDHARLYAELVHVAAMAQRMAEDLAL